MSNYSYCTVVSRQSSDRFHKRYDKESQKYCTVVAVLSIDHFYPLFETTQSSCSHSRLVLSEILGYLNHLTYNNVNTNSTSNKCLNCVFNATCYSWLPCDLLWETISLIICIFFILYVLVNLEDIRSFQWVLVAVDVCHQEESFSATSGKLACFSKIVSVLL